MRTSGALADEGVYPSISDEILTSLARLGCAPVPRRVRRGDLVSLSDGRAAGVHVLSQGRAKLLRFSDEGRVILLDLVDPGDVFGTLSFLSAGDAAPVPVSYAEALEDSRLHTIPRLTFERLLTARPGLALRVASLVGERCNQLERRLEAQVFHRVPVRLARQLLDLADRYGVATPDGTLLALGLSQQDLGNLIGASREIVSLTLSEFKRKGLVSAEGRRLVLHDERLRAELDTSLV